jgi:hypothetical protein
MTPRQHYASPPLTIGKHEWRIVVQDSRFGGRCTAYQWRPVGTDQWRTEREWPSYNFNDGTTAGLPLTLRVLFERERDEVGKAMDWQPEPKQQLTLIQR